MTPPLCLPTPHDLHARGSHGVDYARGAWGDACVSSPRHATDGQRLRPPRVTHRPWEPTATARIRSRGASRGAVSHVFPDTRLDAIPIARRLSRGFVQDVFRPPSRRGTSRHVPTAARRAARQKTLCLPLTVEHSLILPIGYLAVWMLKSHTAPPIFEELSRRADAAADRPPLAE